MVSGRPGRASPHCCAPACFRRSPRENCRARESEAWPLDLMTPGRRPLLELATRIAAASWHPSRDIASRPAHRPRKDHCHDPPSSARPRPAPRHWAEPARHRQVVGTQAVPTWREPLLGGHPAVRTKPPLPPWLGGLSDPAGAYRRSVRRTVYSITDEQERRIFIQALCAAATRA